MPVKIYITGCARSGTTLLARLFHSFEGVEVMNQEVSLSEFCDVEPIKNILVGKRTEQSLFSNTLSTKNIASQRELISIHGICVINCIRDGRDVVHAWVKAWGMYDPFAWMNAVDQSRFYPITIAHTVRYEELLSKPDVVQGKLMRRFPDLQKQHDFSLYPSFVPDYCFPTMDERYRLRPITAPVRLQSATYLKRPNDIIYFEHLLKELGYHVRN